MPDLPRPPRETAPRVAAPCVTGQHARVSSPPTRHPAPPRRLPGVLGQAWLVAEKDLKIELRTGEVVTTAGFFALLVVVLASLSFYGGPATGRSVAAGVIWLSVAFAAVLALGRSWQREREEGALTGLITSPLSASAIFLGKTLGIGAFLLVVQAIVLPVAGLLYALEPAEVAPGLLLLSLAATPGIAASGALFGAMTVRTSARDLLLAVVLFPLLSPTLLSAVAATRALFDGAPLAELRDYLQFLLVFDVLFVTGGLTMFGALVDG